MRSREFYEFSKYLKLMIGYLAIGIVFTLTSFSSYANSGITEVPGEFYEFEKGSNYEFHEGEPVNETGKANTYGVFGITGDITTVDNNLGLPTYEVDGEKLEFFYNYNSSLLTDEIDSWHLVDDDSKKVADFELDANIKKGTILIQTSKDQKNWITAKIINNAFSDVPIRLDSIYSATDIQLINGSYFRVIVVYQLDKRIEVGNIPIINPDKFQHKKVAEVYEFYVSSVSDDNEAEDTNEPYKLGEKVRVKEFDGYSGEDIIDVNDPHYGWDLGDFYIQGYTDKTKNADGDVIFLKNAGDKVALFFRLDQNIDSLNGIDNLFISRDTNGFDHYFETPKMDLGRGVLIIRYTDHNNIATEPIIYTNYLEADASVGADTKVMLFEEGDYEVALDYEITSDELFDKVGHYRIFFKFSVRNGNTMVFPFDVKTGGELVNSEMTENGFFIDFAKSRYLKINVKREILTDNGDRLKEDTRSNAPAKDGEEYREEGIYTISVDNEYTGQSTEKKIYVGDDKLLRAHMVTGMSISEINGMVDKGATIEDDGNIRLAETNIVDESLENIESSGSIKEDFTSEPNTSELEGNETESEENNDEGNSIPMIMIIAGGAVILLLVGVVMKLKKKKNKQDANEHFDESEDNS